MTQPTLRQEDINSQYELLAVNRERLAHLLRQRDTLGIGQTPPGIIADIRDARTRIRQIKDVLRAAGTPVEDYPNDDAESRELFYPPVPLVRRTNRAVPSVIV